MDDRHPVWEEGWDSAKEGVPARTRAIRAGMERLRVAVELVRSDAPTERDQLAEKRDERAARRDLDADAADQRSLELSLGDTLADRHTLRVRDLRTRAVEGRARATRDRERAARDRLHSARDRALGAVDREESSKDRTRGTGLKELGKEMQRARRDDSTLVAACVDVKGPMFVTDDPDDLLTTVADVLQQHLRSYDLLVRIGDDDELLCALHNISLVEARQRFDALSAEVQQSVGRSVSVGFSALLDTDSPDDFAKRADDDLPARRCG